MRPLPERCVGDIISFDPQSCTREWAQLECILLRTETMSTTATPSCNEIPAYEMHKVLDEMASDCTSTGRVGLTIMLNFLLSARFGKHQNEMIPGSCINFFPTYHKSDVPPDVRDQRRDGVVLGRVLCLDPRCEVHPQVGGVPPSVVAPIRPAQLDVHPGAGRLADHELVEQQIVIPEICLTFWHA